MASSTKATPRRKPSKPARDFSLWKHAGTGQWAKKIRGRRYYFGSFRLDPDGTAAQEQYERELPYLKKGETPPTIDVTNGLTLKALVNDFLNEKEGKVNSSELSPRTFRDYYQTCSRLVEHFGRTRLVTDLRPDDFRAYRTKLATAYGPISIKNEINRVASVFNHALANNLIEKPVSYGNAFDRPSAKSLRKARNDAGPKLFEREEIHKLLAVADPQLRAMILLGVNAGFGNTDVASLPISAVNLETAWVDFPRPKTEVARHIPLWPETVEALRAALAVRPRPEDPAHGKLCFLSRFGKPWVRTQAKVRVEEDADESKPDVATKPNVPIDALSQAFGKVLHSLGINGRKRLGFYTLRHCFETYAGESADQVAVDAIMGHVDSSMAANYRHRISDDRLRTVVERVRAWLFGTSTPEGGAK